MKVFGAGLIALLFSTSAFAQAPESVAPLPGAAEKAAAANARLAASKGPDEVIGKAGGTVHCTVVAVRSDDKAVILLSDGTQLAISWTEIAAVKRNGVVVEGDVAARPHSDVQLKAPVAASGPGPSYGRPRLHIETNRSDLGLYVFTGRDVVHQFGGTTIVTKGDLICTAPCDRVIESTGDHTYFFAGPDLSFSSQFTLYDRSGDLTAKVDPGQRESRLGGALVTAFAGIGALTGLILLAAGGAQAAASTDPTTQHSASSIAIAGGALAGVSGGLLFVGIPLYLSGRTTYTFDSGSTSKSRSALRLTPMGLSW